MGELYPMLTMSISVKISTLKSSSPILKSSVGFEYGLSLVFSHSTREEKFMFSYYRARQLWCYREEKFVFLKKKSEKEFCIPKLDIVADHIEKKIGENVFNK